VIKGTIKALYLAKLSGWERRTEWSSRPDVIVSHGRIRLKREKKYPLVEVKERVRRSGNCHEVERDGNRIHEGCGFVLKVRYYLQFCWIIAVVRRG
jgi:hypothetical protein